MCMLVMVIRLVFLVLLNLSRYGWCWKKLVFRCFFEICMFGCM